MFKSIMWALAAGILTGKMMYQFQVRMGWKVALALLASGIGGTLILVFPEQYRLEGIFLLIMGLSALLSSMKEFSGAASWRSYVYNVACLVLLSFASDVREFLSRVGWNDCMGLFVLPFWGYVIGGAIVVLRPWGWSIIFLCSIFPLFFGIESIKSGLAIVPAVIGCLMFFISWMAWKLALRRMSPKNASSIFVLSALVVLVFFF